MPFSQSKPADKPETGLARPLDTTVVALSRQPLFAKQNSLTDQLEQFVLRPWPLVTLRRNARALAAGET
ncbi:hypothetical protein C7S18_00525 [Ahniella affigens]|uniref:Uncharacterized protein n=1 Tax=Ahniella affigens TaxID=2021234 RepID=A0A2P1PLQ1_9GAMM|nr:hypothetical protein C7S18_00525 [Ahniella affigens]